MLLQLPISGGKSILQGYMILVVGVEGDGPYLPDGWAVVVVVKDGELQPEGFVGWAWESRGGGIGFRWWISTMNLLLGFSHTRRCRKLVQSYQINVKIIDALQPYEGQKEVFILKSPSAVRKLLTIVEQRMV